MPVERRGWVTHGVCWVNGKPEEPSCLAGRRQPSLSGTSRMRRESHVRICERLGVKFPGPTRRGSLTALLGQRETGGTQLFRRKAPAFVEWHEPDEARVSCPDVCPAKAGMFSRRKACRGKSQEPRSLDSRVAGNQDSEAYRPRLPREDDESPGRNDSERKSGLENE